MGDHICAKVPPSPKTAPATMQHQNMSNPFTIRQMNASDQRLVQPSPLQKSSTPPPQTRNRAPTLSSRQMPTPKAVRPAPPRINPDAANKPFLAPFARSDSPASPASSVRSGSSNGGRPPPMRSQTSPMPRLWDPRPPSPEISANFDCAFPHFPTETTSGSRSSSRNGRRTPAGSERASSRSRSRQGGRIPVDREPKSPVPNAGESVMQKMQISNSGPFDGSQRRPSRDDRPQHELAPLDNRRPSMPKDQRLDQYPSRPSTANSNHSQVLLATTSMSNHANRSKTINVQRETPTLRARG